MANVCIRHIETSSYSNLFNLDIENYCSKGLFSLSNGTSVDVGIAEQCNYWLKCGLTWYYAFNHEEAIECFKRVISLSGDTCAMAHWGISICNGSILWTMNYRIISISIIGHNYNTIGMSRETFPSAYHAHYHAQRAFELSKVIPIRQTLSSIEIALIDALQVRFNPLPEDESIVPIYENTEAYVHALEIVFAQFPDIPCIGCLYVESLLNYSPWKLWDLNTGIPKSYTITAKEILEKSLLLAPNHIGLLHLYIHLMEMSPYPELALPHCAILQHSIPDTGHLIHMPSHIHVLCGMYWLFIVSILFYNCYFNRFLGGSCGGKYSSSNS